MLWVLPAGRGLRLTSRPAPGAVCLAGPGRLAALRGMLRHATSLTLHGPEARPGSGPLASVWVLDSPSTRLTFMLSPEPYRGFSGEGAVLTGLAGNDDEIGFGPALDAEAVGVELAEACAAGVLALSRAVMALGQATTSGAAEVVCARAGRFRVRTFAISGLGSLQFPG